MERNNDWYQILGISPDADLETINRAYRKRALEWHPDRGGSHEKMILANKAWEFLSNPESRRAYDAARANPDNRAAQDLAAAYDEAARAQAEQYPRKWTEFESWLNRVTSDFVNAKHGSQKDGVIPFPTIEGSASGMVFICLGGGLGLVAALLLGFNSTDPKIRKELFHLIIGFTAAGAWVGAIIHRWIGNILRAITGARRPHEHQSQSPDQEDSASPVIIMCDKCGKKLRIPPTSKKLLVTCPACRHQFTHS